MNRPIVSPRRKRTRLSSFGIPFALTSLRKQRKQHTDGSRHLTATTSAWKPRRAGRTQPRATHRSARTHAPVELVQAPAERLKVDERRHPGAAPAAPADCLLDILDEEAVADHPDAALDIRWGVARERPPGRSRHREGELRGARDSVERCEARCVSERRDAAAAQAAIVRAAQAHALRWRRRNVPSAADAPWCQLDTPARTPVMVFTATVPYRTFRRNLQPSREDARIRRPIIHGTSSVAHGRRPRSGAQPARRVTHDARAAETQSASGHCAARARTLLRPRRICAPPSGGS